MTSKQHTAYGPDVVAEVSAEINRQLDAADAVMPRWLQLVDPGIGFAKGEEENVLLLQPQNMQRLSELLGNRPLFVGASRKRFLGAIIDRSATERKTATSTQPSSPTSSLPSSPSSLSEDRLQDLDWATAATTCAAVAGGASIVRVHNVRGTRHVCDVMQVISNAAR
jgi:dihydropteroate synthase